MSSDPNGNTVAGSDWKNTIQRLESVKMTLSRSIAYNTSIPAAHGIHYWARISPSFVLTSLFYLQHAPVELVKLLKAPQKTYQSLHETLRTWLKAANNLSVPKSRQQLVTVIKNVLTFVFSIPKFYQAPAKRICELKCKELKAVKDKSNEQIGKLLANSKYNDNIDEKNYTVARVSQEIRDVAAVINASLAGHEITNTPESADEALTHILHSYYSNKTAGFPKSSFIPKFYVRWWPAALIAGYAMCTVRISTDELLEWLQTSVFDTVKSFWRNWVIDPIYHVYLTIRHDPTSQLALIANESLDTDIISLNQMVTDFIKDNGLELADSPDVALTSANYSNLDRNVNMIPVMNAYEQQLRTPIRGIFSGHLLRTALIQIQKFKVDSEVALKGIDQLIQSQQLVFGLVAAVPAFMTLFWVLLLANRQFTGKQLNRFTTVKNFVIENLGNLDTIVRDCQNVITDTELGSIYCQTVLIKDHCRDEVNKTSISQLVNGLNRLLKTAVTTKDLESVMTELDRVYIRFR